MFVSGLKQNKKISIINVTLKVFDGRTPRSYNLPKIHKQRIHLRPIISFVESRTYNLSKNYHISYLVRWGEVNIMLKIHNILTNS